MSKRATRPSMAWDRARHGLTGPGQAGHSVPSGHADLGFVLGRWPKHGTTGRFSCCAGLKSMAKMLCRASPKPANSSNTSIPHLDHKNSKKHVKLSKSTTYTSIQLSHKLTNDRLTVYNIYKLSLQLTDHIFTIHISQITLYNFGGHILTYQ
jgi:hypothetical protein